MVLEWNLGPSKESWRFPPTLSALIQAEMLMEFIDARVEITCLWPLIWRSNPAVWPGAARFPSIVTGDPPFSRTRSLDLFRLVASVQGCIRVAADDSRPDVPALAFLQPDGRKLRLLVLNKSPEARRVVLRTSATAAAIPPASVETITLASHAESPPPDGFAGEDAGRVLQPMSFSLITAEQVEARPAGGPNR